MDSLRLRFLGPPRIERNGQLLDTDTRKATALLAYLALTGERQSRDALAAFLWPDFDDSRAKAALRRTLSALKSAVGGDALYITREVIGLEAGETWCDVADFQAMLSGEPDIEQLQAAVSLYRDDFLSGFSLRDSLPFDDWQLLQAQSLRRDLETALEELTSRHIAQEAYDQALPLAHRWLALDPLREEVHRLLMQLYAWLGQPNAALRQYRDCVRILEEELGVSPLAETTALYEAIQHDRLKRPQTEAEVDVAPRLPRPQFPTGALPLVGREAELAAMQTLYRQVGPDGRFLVLSGEPGIGKTALAEAFLATLPGCLCLRARCYEGENRLAYAPFVQALREALHRPAAVARLADVSPSWLSEAARLLPELFDEFPDLPEAPSLDWAGASGRFVEGVSQVLLALLDGVRRGARPGVLWLDEAQWADAASLDLLTFLAHRWRDRPYLILVCWRGGDLAADHRLRQLLAESGREGSGLSLPLARLNEEAVSQLVAEAAGAGDLPESMELAPRLFRETEGLPFLLNAYLQTLPQTSSEAEQWRLPATARDLFHSHLAQTSETEGQLLQAAAVIGRAFDFELLLSASGRSEEESLLALEGLLDRHLLVEGPAGASYDFYHHKLRDLIYEETSLVRRRLLHRRVAQSMSARPAAHRSGEIAGLIAAHFQEAGMDEQAAGFYRQAGDYARSLFAHRDALQHYQAALALGHPETGALHELCGDLHVRLGEYAAALTSYEMAAAVSPPEQLAQLEHRIGRVYYRRGEWKLAEHHFEQALAQWLPGDDMAQLFIDWSVTAYRAGATDKATSLAAKGSVAATTPLAQAELENVLGVLARKQGNLSIAIDHFNCSLMLASEHDFLAVQITAANNLALAEAATGQYQRACDRLRGVLELCRTYGDRHWEAALRSNLADILHTLGNDDESMAQFKEAVTIYADIGQEIGDARPEIWKLTEW
jgi:DNA-binding SARP family transcriptional activator/Flp pilus assembly protein TadD